MPDWFFLQLVALGLGVLCAVLSAWFARKNNVREIRADVDDLISLVEKVGRMTRTEKMKRIRAMPTEPEVPPELRPAAPAILSKNDLRRMAARGSQ